MNATAHEACDFRRWMDALDEESRDRLNRFLELTAEAAQIRDAAGPET
jgi:hypothetical protein